MTVDKLKVRAQAKKRKPTFKRSQTNQFAKLAKGGYRKPKGMGNKMRRTRRGHLRLPTVGYGSPREVKGLNREGFREIMVNNVSDLSKVNAKTDAVVISSTVGGKKKLEILAEIKKLKLIVANVKDIDATIKSLTKEKKVKKSKKEEKAAQAESKEEPSKEVTKDDSKKTTAKEETKKWT